MTATLIDARPAAVNLALYAGDDFWLDIAVTDPAGDPADLTGQTARSDIRSRADMPVVASFTATIAGNVIHLYLAGADVAGLPQAAVWDCQLADADTVTLAAGNVRTWPQVTV